MFKCVFPLSHVRGQAHLRKKVLPELKGLLQATLMAQTPAEKEKQGNMITTNISSDAPEDWTHRVKYCLVFGFYAREESSQREDSIFQGMPLRSALCFKDGAIFVFLSGLIYYDSAENRRLSVCLPRASDITNKIILQKTDVVWVPIFWTCGFHSAASNLVQKENTKKKASWTT